MLPFVKFLSYIEFDLYSLIELNISEHCFEYLGKLLKFSKIIFILFLNKTNILFPSKCNFFKVHST